MNFDTPDFFNDVVWPTDKLIELVMETDPRSIPVDLYYALAERGIEVDALY